MTFCPTVEGGGMRGRKVGGKREKTDEGGERERKGKVHK